MRFLDCLVCCNKWYISHTHLMRTFWKKRFFTYFQLCRRAVSRWSLSSINYITITECYVKVNCSFLPQFFFFLNLSVTCWLAVGRLSVTCRSTVGRQLTDSRPTGFLGSSSSQLPEAQQLLLPSVMHIYNHNGNQYICPREDLNALEDWQNANFNMRDAKIYCIEICLLIDCFLNKM